MIDSEVEKVGMKIVFIMTTGIGGYDFVFWLHFGIHFSCHFAWFLLQK